MLSRIGEIESLSTAPCRARANVEWERGFDRFTVLSVAGARLLLLTRLGPGRYAANCGACGLRPRREVPVFHPAFAVRRLRFHAESDDQAKALALEWADEPQTAREHRIAA